MRSWRCDSKLAGPSRPPRATAVDGRGPAGTLAPGRFMGTRTRAVEGRGAGQVERQTLQRCSSVVAVFMLIFLAAPFAIPASASEPRPASRSYHALAYDAGADRIVLFGGWVEDSNGETWTYDLETNEWAQMNPTAPPPARDSHAMAYDSQSRRVILFGGVSGFPGLVRNDTWAYDYATDLWTNMAPAGGPSPRIGARMVYSVELDRIVLFGGHDGQCHGDTWTYDFESNVWTEMTPASSPAPRAWQAFAYDIESRRIVLFGGDRNCMPGSPFGDTWTYDIVSNSWQNLNPAESPTARAHGSVAYDRGSDRIVLFGGSEGPDETHAYDVNANVWARVTPTPRPSGRMAHAMAYDEQSDRVVLFGGSWPPGLVTDPSVVNVNDTWSYDVDSNAWTQLDPPPTPPSPNNLVLLVAAVAAVVAVAAVSLALWRRRRHKGGGGREG